MTAMVMGIPRGRWALFLATAGMAVLLAALVRGGGEGPLHRFDEGVLLALRSPLDRADPIGPLWVEIMFRDLTALGSHAVLLLIGLAAAAYLALLRERTAILLLGVSLLGGIALGAGLKLVFARPRPELVAHLADTYTASFPSGHAMLSAIAYLTLAGLLARVQPRASLRRYVLAVGIALTVLVGASRIYLGVHWPSDVVAGWCFGAAWALFCRGVVDRLDGARHRRPTHG